MNVLFHDHVDAFLREAGPILESHEDTASLVLGICQNLKRGRQYGEEPPLFASVREHDRVCALAVRTPPHSLVLYAEEKDLEALGVLAERLHAEGAALPGCHGPLVVVEAFARAWSRLTQCVPSVTMQQKIFRLDTVLPPSPTPGRLRLATESDADWLADWTGAFHREAVPGDSGRDQRHLVDWLLSQGHLWVWEHDGPVSICAAVRPTAHGIAIGLVYTPPEHRGCGYASNCVAQASQCLLDEGYDFCTLFTDLSNPTSNKIYQAIGYRPLAEFRQIKLADPSD